MKFNEMKELAVNDWDGKNFKAYVSDIGKLNREATDDNIVTITGYNNEKWIDFSGYTWQHAYPVELNRAHLKRMTKRQLALWLAQGHGEWKLKGSTTVKTYFTYFDSARNEPVVPDVQVRLKDSDEWIEPTIDLLDEE